MIFYGELDMEKPQVSDGVFVRYVEQSQSKLRGYAYRLCGEWSAAEDLTQATLVILYRRWAALDHHSAITAYARKVMLREFLYGPGAAWRRREIPSELLPEPEPLDSSDDICTGLMVRHAMTVLPPAHLAATVLRFWYGLTTPEIADRLGQPVGTVRSHLSRSVVTLRPVLRTAETGRADKQRAR
jgi:RNA polymerase sigma factor (sigma-70 family)